MPCRVDSRAVFDPCPHGSRWRAAPVACRASLRQQQRQQQEKGQPLLPSAAKHQQQVQQHTDGQDSPFGVLRVPSLVAGDEEKELSRAFRRTTFDHERWAMHRSTSRYWRHIRSMLRSRVIKGLAAPLLYVGAVSAAVCCYEMLLHEDLLPHLGFVWPKLAIQASGIFSISTFALSLLLVFRTNSAYQRWNDARKLWGLTTNRCRDLSRQVTQWLTDPADAELVGALCRHIRAFPIALMDSLRNDHDLEADLHAVLQADEVELLLQQPHVGTAVLQAMGVLLAESHAREAHKLRIDENITVLQDTMGGCERILRTPIPLFYTRHTSRFLICWLTILPFNVADEVGWLTVPIACGVAFFLLGIEEIGVQVEEPHGILALEIFCETIIRNVNQAEQAAAAMRGMAAARAARLSSSSCSSDDGNSSSSSSSSSSSLQQGPAPAMPVGWRVAQPQPRGPQRVAGQPVPAAEEAFNVSCSATFDDISTLHSGSLSGSSEDAVTPRSSVDGSGSAQASGSGSSAQPGGGGSSSRPGYGVAGSSSSSSSLSSAWAAAAPDAGVGPSEAEAYRHSCVSEGALDDSEGFSF